MSNLDTCLSSYSCDTDISLIKQIAKNHNLTAYLQLLLKHLSITDLDSYIADKNKIQKEHINLFKRTLCIYEGCIHNNLSPEMIKIGILYGFFNRLITKNSFVEQIHRHVKKNPLDEISLNILLDIIDRSTFRNRTSDLVRVIKDSSVMVVYYDDYLNPEIKTLFENYYKNMPLADTAMAVKYVYMQLKKTKWLTRWANMKAFTRNFNKVIDQREKEALDFIKEN